jgi:polyisoprenyl-phosphate glycosyltransferase
MKGWTALVQPVSESAGVKLSVVIPAFNEEGALPELLLRTGRVLESLGGDWELIVVDDGSTDGTWAIVESAAREDPRIRGIRLSRNFGHQVALTAGLSAAAGAAVITMDGDLQHPPETIAALVAKANEGFDVVYGVRSVSDAEGWFKIRSARLFYRTVNALSSLDLPIGAADFRLMSRRVVDALILMPERHRFLRGMTRWVGFPQATVSYDRDARFRGRSKYTYRAMLKLAIDAIVGFSSFPLRLASMLGLLLAFVGGLYFIYVLGVGLFSDSAVQGWTSVVGVVLVLGGVQLASIGIIGQYLGRMYDELKNRPLFVVQADTREDAPLPRDPDRPAPEPAAPL